jgi:hypothetical protein
VPAEIEPPELARLIDYAERPRVDDWSLRAALTRYAQPQPQRASDVYELVRRIEYVTRPQLSTIARAGDDIWRALHTDGPSGPSGPADPVVELLRVMTGLDRLGDVLAEWAADPSHERPDAAVDAATRAAGRRLEELGVPREPRPTRPPRSSGRGS